MAEAIAYYRVSTQKQGQSGLGLEAQKTSVMKFAQARGLGIAAEYTEVETGTRKRHRPELELALMEARARGAVLLIAKLDRLARNVAFISALMDSGVDFIAVDMPQANKLTIHILAAVAENEAELISQRTKAALAAAKARGVKLGTPENLTPEASQKGGAVLRDRARKAYKETAYTIKLQRSAGLSYNKIAKGLNEEGLKTRTGRPFTAMTVWRIDQRNGALSA
jgi:DNA invertase Pin-like site-specific DNA recombinase